MSCYSNITVKHNILAKLGNIQRYCNFFANKILFLRSDGCYVDKISTFVSLMKHTITINDGSTLYVGRHTELLPELLPSGRVIVITDANIDRHYRSLVGGYEHIIIGGGEANKSLQSVTAIYDRLMAMGADRSTFLVGIGGGIVTDIVGFVATTYMRGLGFGFLSTTLLGQVDASIGGKNGVNVAGYKNMVGTFSHPRFVISDVEMLRTLPLRELRAGMAEAVKSAIVGDAELFDYIETHASEAIYTDTEALQNIVLRSVAVKSRIVQADEREGGLRRQLNLGHTLGHAIEKLTHRLNHGEAVAVGMSLIAHAAVGYSVLKAADAKRIDDLLTKLGFSLEPPVPIAEILREVRYDKKKYDDSLHAVMPEAIGRCRVVELKFEEFEKLF